MRIFLLFIFLWTSFAYADSPSPKMNSARVLLSKVRGGDFAHAGDRESIDIVIEKALQLCPGIQAGSCLDIGSGFGGTADAIYHLGFQNIYGIDIDAAAVAYAQKKYPHIKFIQGDAFEISSRFQPNSFSFVYLFNVFYAIEDKRALLKQIHMVTKPEGILALFDYTAKEDNLFLKDFAGKPMRPMVLSTLRRDLIDSGWEILEIIDLTDEHLLWYQNLLTKLDEQHNALALEFSEEDIARVTTTFQTIVKWLQDSSLGGALIFAKKLA